jgi:hypothetical protein
MHSNEDRRFVALQRLCLELSVQMCRRPIRALVSLIASPPLAAPLDDSGTKQRGAMEGDP